jgi:uncharacterized protein YqjF (DUF2071 family)
MEEWIEHQLRERQEPVRGSGVMLQSWQHLLFLHWRVEPKTVQQTLPGELCVDTYEGEAWIGIVPFCMRNVRPTVLPWLTTNFLELNLRTYVKDHNGTPGVWFYSLDANYPIAVWSARLFLGLPYRHAKMDMVPQNESITYFCQRRSSSTRQRYKFQPTGDLWEAEPGSLEFFLVERYRLFSVRNGQLLTGRVYHPPYQLRKATVSDLQTDLFELDALQRPTGAPSSALYSTGVDVRIYPVEAVR